MNKTHLVNGLFEFVGACFMMRDVFQLHRDKDIKGVYWPSRFLFATWGIWNLWYYPRNSDWFSFSGGIALVTVNLIWCYLALKYRPHGQLLFRSTKPIESGQLSLQFEEDNFLNDSLQEQHNNSFNPTAR